MKLVDILARELKAWPEGVDSVWQSSFDNEIYFDADVRPFYTSLNAEDSGDRGAVIAQAEWQAAVDALNAPKVVEPEIDWSRQPEGFPLWLEGTTEAHRKYSGWYRRSGQIFEGSDGGQCRSVREGQFFTVHRKPDPKVVEWDGVGRPPAGSTCQIRHSGWAAGSWEMVDIKYISSEYLIIGHGYFKREQHFHMPDIQFRPILTAEQVAAEEREKARTEVLNAMTKGKNANEPEALWKFRLKVVGEMLDMGYRKQVEK